MEMFDFFSPKSPHCLRSPPSMASLSCVPDVANINGDGEKKDQREEEVLSPRPWLTLNSFSTTIVQESLAFPVRDDSGSNRRQEIAATTLESNTRESVQSSVSGVETKRSSCGAVSNKNKRPPLGHKEEEGHYEGISTELVLYEDPWKIKKKLKPSDLGNLSRLLLPGDSVKTHVLQWMGEEMVKRVRSKDGMDVAVWDADTGDEHSLVFRYWFSSNSYVLNGEWTQQFVKRRGLKVDDEIGMLLDTNACMFHFTVIRKVACGTSIAAA